MKNNRCKWTRLAVAACGVALTLGPARAAQVEAHFIGAGITDWGLAANWAEGVVPANTASTTFNVVVDNSRRTDYAQINIQPGVEISRLDLFGNLFLAVTQPAELRIRDFFAFRAGTLGGNGGVYDVLGDAEFSGFAIKYLATSTLNMHGVTRWTGGHLDFSGYSSVRNHAGALFSIETGGYFGAPGNTSSASVRNDGTIRLNAPGTISRWYSEITNTVAGLIDVQAGQMVLQAPLLGGGGTLRVRENASVVSRWFASFAGMQVENAGEIRFEGSVGLAADTALPGQVTLLNSLSGPGALTVGQMQWRGGRIDGPGALTIPGGRALEAFGSGLLYTRPLLNQGSFIIHQDSNAKTSLEATNDTTGVVFLEGGTQWGSGALVNRGQIVKDASAGGAELLIPAIANSGLIRVEGGLLQLQGALDGGDVEIREGARLWLQSPSQNFTAHGSGSILLVRENTAQLDPNLELICANTTLSGAASYSLRSLEIAGGLAMSPAGQMEAIQQFRFTRGGLAQTALRSRGAATLAFSSDGAIQDGGDLTLDGKARWLGGNLDIGDGGVLRNHAEMQVSGAGLLRVGGDGRIENSGPWSFLNSITNVTLNLKPTLATLQTMADPSSAPPGPSAFAARGQFQLTTNGLAASSAELRFSSLIAVNSALILSNTVASASVSAKLTNTLLWLQNSAFGPPPSPLEGSPILKGAGRIAGALAVSQLTLWPDATNDIHVDGSLTANGLAATIDLTGGSVLAPRLIVAGSINLGGHFDLAIKTNTYLFNAVPVVTLLESALPITAAFSNVKSGDLVVTVDGNYQARVYFGTDSPFGANKLVLAEIGSAFDRWRSVRFTPQQLSQPIVSGPNADPDGNGFSNLAEYVFGINSAKDAPSIDPLPQLGYALFTARVRKGAELFQPRLGVSPDLTNWTDFAPGTEAGSVRLLRIYDDADFRIYWYSYPGIPASLFLRTSVVVP